MNITIRPLRDGETEHLVRVHEEAATVAYAHIFGGAPFPREDSVNRWRFFTGKIAVAEEDGRIVGFVAYDDVELHALYVLPTYQGSGLGSRLLAIAGSVSKLWVLKDNHLARSFYEARGWDPSGAQRTRYGSIVLQYRRSDGSVNGRG